MWRNGTFKIPQCTYTIGYHDVDGDPGVDKREGDKGVPIPGGEMKRREFPSGETQ